MIRYNRHKEDGGFTQYELRCSFPSHFKKQPLYRLVGTDDAFLAIPHEWYQDVIMFLIRAEEIRDAKNS